MGFTSQHGIDKAFDLLIVSDNVMLSNALDPVLTSMTLAQQQQLALSIL